MSARVAIWNCLQFSGTRPEALIAVVAGLVAGSIALVGFGLDSVIEVSSGVVLLWRLSLDADAARREKLEKPTALKIVGISFLALASYVAYDGVTALWAHELPEGSYIGIAVAALSLVVMPLLARAKRRVASRIQSRALQADSRQYSIYARIFPPFCWEDCC